MQRIFHFFSEYKISLAILILALLSGFPGVAQHVRKTSAKPIVKTINPILKTRLGNLPTGTFSADILRQMLNSGLKVTDQFHKNYRVLYFNFGFQSPDTSFNDTTGIPQIIKDYVDYSFNANSLDTLWLGRIGQELQPGDTLFFDRIVAEDSVRHIKYGAPPIKLAVK